MKNILALITVACIVPSSINALGIKYNEGPNNIDIAYHLYPDEKSSIEKHSLHNHSHPKNATDVFRLQQGKTNCHQFEKEEGEMISPHQRNENMFAFIKICHPRSASNVFFAHKLKRSGMYIINLEENPTHKNMYKPTIIEVDPNSDDYAACMSSK